jgi:hypothetical protein
MNRLDQRAAALRSLVVFPAALAVALAATGTAAADDAGRGPLVLQALNPWIPGVNLCELTRSCHESKPISLTEQEPASGRRRDQVN